MRVLNSYSCDASKTVKHMTTKLWICYTSHSHSFVSAMSDTSKRCEQSGNRKKKIAVKSRFKTFTAQQYNKGLARHISKCT